VVGGFADAPAEPLDFLPVAGRGRQVEILVGVALGHQAQEGGKLVIVVGAAPALVCQPGN